MLKIWTEVNLQEPWYMTINRKGSRGFESRNTSSVPYLGTLIAPQDEYWRSQGKLTPRGERHGLQQSGGGLGYASGHECFDSMGI